MSLAAIVATGMLALMLGFVGMVLYATMRQLRVESEAVARQREPY